MENENIENSSEIQGQRLNNNGLRANSPMEQARQNGQRGFDQNPYINEGAETQTAQTNPYYNSVNSEPNSTLPNQTPQQPSMMDSLYGSFDTSNFIKGALIGAVGAYLLTNEDAQKTIFKGIAKATDMFQAGAEEMKERFEDAKAEMEAERS